MGYRGDAAITDFWHDKQVPSWAAKEHLSPQGHGLVCQDRIVQTAVFQAPSRGDPTPSPVRACERGDSSPASSKQWAPEHGTDFRAGEPDALLVEDGPGYQGLVSTV